MRIQPYMTRPNKWAIIDGNEIIADVYSENDALPRIMAACYDLLAECKRAQDEIASGAKDGPGHFTPEMLRAWFNGVTEVIKKAEGKR